MKLKLRLPFRNVVVVQTWKAQKIKNPAIVREYYRLSKRRLRSKQPQNTAVPWHGNTPLELREHWKLVKREQRQRKRQAEGEKQP